MMEKTYFAECINEYEKGRPPYDKKIFETIVSFAGLDKNDCCLEIGAGPGTATAYMGEYKVDALEITREQVLYFNKKYENYENINMYQCSFEEYSTEKNMI